MNNEEKVKKMLECDRCPFRKGKDSENNCNTCFDKKLLLKIAQWKDEQFDKKLQEIVDYVYPLICGGERLHINEIIGKDMVWKH